MDEGFATAKLKAGVLGVKVRIMKPDAKLPDEIIFYGVEPQNVTPSLELSSVVQGKLKYVVKKIFEELKIFFF